MTMAHIAKMRRNELAFNYSSEVPVAFAKRYLRDKDSLGMVEGLKTSGGEASYEYHHVSRMGEASNPAVSGNGQAADSSYDVLGAGRGRRDSDAAVPLYDTATDSQAQAVDQEGLLQSKKSC